MPSDPTQAVQPADCLSRLTRHHTRRLREMYRSAGWPLQDIIEIELVAAGLLERCATATGPETLRVTDAGIQCLAQTAAQNRTALSVHDGLVQRVAQTLQRDGRIVWTGLSVRVRLHSATVSTNKFELSPMGSLLANEAMTSDVPVHPAMPHRYKVCKPDVFSVRNTSLASYLNPIVHEVKVSRADLLGDLRQPDKRDSYLGVGGQCWYVLGCDRRGEAIAEPDEIPVDCGVLMAQADRLIVARPAPRRPVQDLPFAVWMALAKSPALPLLSAAEDAEQAPLVPSDWAMAPPRSA